MPGSQVPLACLLRAPPRPVSTPQSRQASLGKSSLPSLYRTVGGPLAGLLSLHSTAFWGEGDHTILCGPALAYPLLPFTHLIWEPTSGPLSFLSASLRAALQNGRLDKIQIFWDTLDSQERGAGTVSSVANEEMKAESGAATCQRSHSKSMAELQQIGPALDFFLNPALQGEAGGAGLYPSASESRKLQCA